MNKIKYLRKQAGMKQTELCRLLNIAQGTLSGWENEKFEPDVCSLIKMSEIFKKSIDYILTGYENASLQSAKEQSVYILKNGEPPFITSEKLNIDMNEDKDCFYVAFYEQNGKFVKVCGEIYLIRKVLKISGEYPIAVYYNNEYSVKWPYINSDGILLISNPPKKPDFISSSDIENKRVNIIGEVVKKIEIYN